MYHGISLKRTFFFLVAIFPVIKCLFQFQERQFLENQRERMEKHMKQLADQHRQKIALLESQYLQQKQQLLRGKSQCTYNIYLLLTDLFRLPFIRFIQ